MLKSEKEQVIHLLKTIYGRRLRSLSEDEEAVWYLVLKPYSYDVCRETLLDYSRKNANVPQPNEIANMIEATMPPPAPQKEKRIVTVLPPEETSPTLWRDYVRHVRAFRTAGVPTAIEAKHSGITYDEWCRMANEAGL